jgi:hypothetical protein
VIPVYVIRGNHEAESIMNTNSDLWLDEFPTLKIWLRQMGVLPTHLCILPLTINPVFVLPFSQPLAELFFKKTMRKNQEGVEFDTASPAETTFLCKFGGS